MARAHLQLVVLLACSPVPLSAHSGPSDQLQELRGRIDNLQRQLAESEGSRSEATDALKASERAISDANRRLFQLSQRAKETRATAGRLEAQRAHVNDNVAAQQALLAKLFYQQYVSGQPEPLRLLLNRQEPEEMARQMYYLGYVTRARADLIGSLRRDLAEIDRLSREVQDKSADL